MLCKIKAYLKLSTEKHPEQYIAVQATIRNRSFKQFTIDNVDFWTLITLIFN